jgi:predicted HD superfamily hydrolase involved in NAD metabolism
VQTLEERVAALPPGLRHHVLAVRATAAALAERFGIDPVRVDLGVLVHDLARAQPPSTLLAYATERNWNLTAAERAFPVFLHGAIGAEAAKTIGVEDEDVLTAAISHTTGSPQMSDLGMIVFLADKLEPGKAERYRGLAVAREWAQRDLRRAMLEALTWMTGYHEDRGDLVHSNTIAARNELMLQLNSQHAGSR